MDPRKEQTLKRLWLLGGALGLSLALAAGWPAVWAEEEEEQATEEGPLTVEDRLQKLEDELEAIKSEQVEKGNTLASLAKVKASGYVQARFVKEEGKDGPNFTVRRARLKVTGQVTDTSSATLQLDAGEGKVSVKDAQVDFAIPNSEVLVTLGQFKWQFGHQVVESSSDRLMPERTRIVRFAFPGERDRGIAFFMKPAESKVPTTYVLGIYDGKGTDKEADPVGKDDDNHLALLGRVAVSPRPNLDAGVSAFWDKATVTVNGAKRQKDHDRFGIDVQYYLENASIQAEYITARDGKVKGTAPSQTLQKTKPSGYYVQYSHSPKPTETVVFRYDSFDPDDGTDTINTWGVAFLHQIDEGARLRLAFEDNDQKDGRVITAEVQVKY